jgi:hypothetical protein
MKMKKSILFLLMLTMQLGMFQLLHTNASENTFTDISGHWAEANIIKAVKNGYVNGYPDGTFKPDEKVTHAEFIKMVVTALGLNIPVDNGSGGINDWYTKYVVSATSAGIYMQDDFSQTEINNPINRFEMSRMSVRAIGQSNNDSNKWMYMATNIGLIVGVDQTGTLAENENTTRAQSVSIIERILAIKSGKQLTTDKHAISRAEVLWHRTNITSMLPRYFGAPLNKPEAFNASAMDFTGDNGNITCNTEQFVAVDMEDPNDPYLSLVPKDLKMRIGNNLLDVPRNTYVIISLNHIKVAKKYGIAPNYQPCYVMFDRLSQLDPNGKYYIDSINNLVTSTIAFSQTDRFIDDIELEKAYPHTFDVLKDQTYKVFAVMPKSDLSNFNTMTDVTFFHPLDFAGTDKLLYHSLINKDIHQ